MIANALKLYLHLLLLHAVANGNGQASSTKCTEHHRYCIVGAGAAGVQLGHFFHKATGGPRDYVIVDRAARAASFFSKFPVHRVLNSINRRFTRSGNLEFNLRHDWNSLLGAHETIGRFTEWTEEYWPKADLLVEYINAFAAPQAKDGYLRFCQNVTSVAPCQSDCAYKLKIERVCDAPDNTCSARGCKNSCAHQDAYTMTCGAVIMANGMWKRRVVKDWIMDLQKFGIPYAEMHDVEPHEFLNKSVLILGEGNAAAETGDAIRNYARDMLFVSRYQGGQTLRETRYVGHVRGRRTTYLDANTFKSYEGQTAMGVNSSRLLMVACGPNNVTLGFRGKPPVCVFSVEDKNVVLAPVTPATQGLIDEAERLFGKKVWTRQAGANVVEHARVAHGMFSTVKFPTPKVLCASVKTIRGKLTDEQRALLPRLRDTTKYLVIGGMEFQFPFDAVITSLGWVYDRSSLSFDLDMLGVPGRKDQQTYPAITAEFESTNAENLFFAGAAAHGFDRYRYKASGGFIHGFRFNCRALFRILETRFEAPEHPHSKPPITTSRQKPLVEFAPILGGGSKEFAWDIESNKKETMYESFWANTTFMAQRPLWGYLVERLNTAGGPYEQVGGSLGDAIVYDCQKQTTWYLEDLPEDLIHDRYLKFPRITWSYFYGTQDYRLREKSLMCGVRSARTAVLGSFIHPVLQYYPPGHGGMDIRLWPHKPKTDHPSVYWMPVKGVSRVHLPDQFVYGDWEDIETLGLLREFMVEVEAAAAASCQGQKGIVKRAFDEGTDSSFFTGEWLDSLEKKAGDCWSKGNDRVII